jgi:hypothetical protein
MQKFIAGLVCPALTNAGAAPAATTYRERQRRTANSSVSAVIGLLTLIGEACGADRSLTFH